MGRGLGMAVTSDYHRRQAETLIRLAQSTKDSETASALMRLAAEHNALAEQTVPEWPIGQRSAGYDPTDR